MAKKSEQKVEEEAPASEGGLEGEIEIDAEGPEAKADAPADADADADADAEADELTGGTLLPRVQELLNRIFDKPERQRFERFFTAAAVAIEGLGALDLSEPEEKEHKEGARNLDALPRSIARALDRVGSFLTMAVEEFPSADEGDDDDIEFDLGEGGAEAAAPDAGPEGLAKRLSAFRLNIHHELRSLREGLEAPVEEDLWPVLERLGEFRGRTRSGIGEMFFLAAREHAVVRKQDVVPFYKEDVDGSLALRRAITTLRARIDVHRTRLQKHLEAESGEGLVKAVTGLHAVFDAFMKTGPYGSLRVVDRRSCFELREELAVLMARDKPARRQVETAVEGLAKFLDSLTLVNQRELLIDHDREAQADTEAHLGKIEGAVAEDKVDEAREALTRAVRTAEPLFGRDPTFDGLHKLLKHVDVAQLDLDDTLALASLMRRHM